MASAKSGPVLPWMRVPIAIKPGSGVPIRDVLGLDSRLAAELEKGSGFSELFPVQAAVWQHSAGGLSTAHDLCVAAPTGSGKTLAYALPLVNALAAQGRCCAGRPRALVVLPTRDLAAQVYDVLRPLCDAVHLRAVLAAARSSEAAEAAQLMGAAAEAEATGSSGRFVSAAGGGGGRFALAAEGGARGGGGGADVVVATPGRLMAHLSGTPGFTLCHLRFLVVDETDRLLRQSYQEWLPRVLEYLAPFNGTQPNRFSSAGAVAADGGGRGGGGATDGAVPLDEPHFSTVWPAAARGTVLPYSRPRVVKIVVSATLTRDPAKLQRLALHHPRYVATVSDSAAAGAGAAGATATAATAAGGGAAGARYSLPRSLSEFQVRCSAARKPLALLALLGDASGQSTIVFTSSLEMTHKLYLMLLGVPGLPEQVVEYSSLVPPRERVAALEKFKTGAARVLVASDAMTRGMDIDAVHNVINYDAPVYAKTYVHRAGRTARAGKPGRVITLLRGEDMRHFKAMIRKADNNFVRDLKLSPERLDGFKPALAGSLQQLEELLAAERRADKQAGAAAAKQAEAGGAGKQAAEAAVTNKHAGAKAAEKQAAAGGAGTQERLEGQKAKQKQKGQGLKKSREYRMDGGQGQDQQREGKERKELEGKHKQGGDRRMEEDDAGNGGGDPGAGKGKKRKAACGASEEQGERRQGGGKEGGGKEGNARKQRMDPSTGGGSVG